MENRIIALLTTCLLMLGTVACGSMTGTGDGFLYTKYISGINGIVNRGELYLEGRKVDDVYLKCLTKIDDDTILGVNHDGPGTTRYVASYNLKTKTLTRITEIENNLEEQRVTANADMSCVYYGDKEKGIVKYDIAGGESEVLYEPEKLKEPMVINDGQTMLYISDWNLMKKDVGQLGAKILAGNVHTYALSKDGSFIIFTRLGAGYKSVVYRYDFETEEETTLMYMDDQISKLSISDDGKSFSYVTYSDAYFSSWARTVVNIFDLDTLNTKVACEFKGKDNIDSIILY